MTENTIANSVSKYSLSNTLMQTFTLSRFLVSYWTVTQMSTVRIRELRFSMQFIGFSCIFVGEECLYFKDILPLHVAWVKLCLWLYRPSVLELSLQLLKAMWMIISDKQKSHKYYCIHNLPWSLVFGVQPRLNCHKRLNFLFFLKKQIEINCILWLWIEMPIF